MKKINDAALENESLTDDLKRMIDKAIDLMGNDFIIRGATYLGVKALVLIEKHLAETMPKTPESPKDKEAEAEPAEPRQIKALETLFSERKQRTLNRGKEKK